MRFPGLRVASVFLLSIFVFALFVSVGTALAQTQSGTPPPGQSGTEPPTKSGTEPPTKSGTEPGSGGITIDLPNPLRLGKCGQDQSDIECLVNRIIKVAWMLAFPIVTLMVLWGAFQLMTAGGDPERVTSARRTILWAVVGFIVLMFASSVVLVLQDIFSTAPPG